MEKTLVYFNEVKYQQEIGSLNNSIKKFKSIIAYYNSLGVGEFRSEEAPDLFFNTEKFIANKIRDANPDNFPVFIKEEFFTDYIKYPKEYKELLSTLTMWKKFTSERIEQDGSGVTLEEYFDNFSFYYNGDIEIKAETIEAIKSKHQRFIETIFGKNTHDFIVNVVSLLEDEERRNQLRINDARSLSEFFMKAVEWEAGKPKASINFICTRDKYAKFPLTL